MGFSDITYKIEANGKQAQGSMLCDDFSEPFETVAKIYANKCNEKGKFKEGQEIKITIHGEERDFKISTKVVFTDS